MLSFFFVSTLEMPTPKRYPGIPILDNNGKVRLQVFIDPLCPDCLAIWPLIEKIQNEYASDVQIIANLLPLPYHTWSFIVTRAIVAVQTLDPTKGKELIHKLFIDGDQEKLSNSALEKYSENEAVTFVLKYVQDNFGFEEETLRKIWNDEEQINWKSARDHFKYAAERMISGTPTVLLNSKMTNWDAETTYETAKAAIDRLM